MAMVEPILSPAFVQPFPHGLNKPADRGTHLIEIWGPPTCLFIHIEPPIDLNHHRRDTVILPVA
jgi:hypothetical protein